MQDEPEVIMHTTEKIETCFQRIKLATRPAAHIYGSVLCQLIYDLVPPKELLTKVIKEFLTVSQPHCEVIARVLFQVRFLKKGIFFADILHFSFIHRCFDQPSTLHIFPCCKIGYYVHYQISLHFQFTK